MEGNSETKRKGSNRLVTFRSFELLRQNRPSRSQLVKRRLLQLGYQPLVDLAPGLVHGAGRTQWAAGRVLDAGVQTHGTLHRLQDVQQADLGSRAREDHAALVAA